jgi:hypothetical protein
MNKLTAIIKDFSVNDLIKTKGNAFYYEIELEIGTELEKGADRFNIDVCNIEGLNIAYGSFIKEKKIIQFDHLMLIDNKNIDFIIKILKIRIESINGNDWVDITSKLTVFLNYEFSPNVPQLLQEW